MPAGPPSTPDPVITAIDNVYVRFSWTAPASNGADITAYYLWILKADGFTLAKSDSCDHVSDPLIIDNQECLIAMSELTDASTYGLPQGRLVSAKLQAENSAGISDYSSYNTVSVLVEVVPHAVPNLVRGALTTQTELDVDWDDFANQSARGGLTASIISYKVEWD